MVAVEQVHGILEPLDADFLQRDFAVVPLVLDIDHVGRSLGSVPATACPLGGEKRVFHEHGDRHRTDAARNGRYKRSDFARRREVDVADEPETFFRGRILDGLTPTSMTAAPGFDHVSVDDARLSDGGDQNVGLPRNRGKIARPRMAYRDGRIAVAAREKD
jgi:hypothetical protein